MPLRESGFVLRPLSGSERRLAWRRRRGPTYVYPGGMKKDVEPGSPPVSPVGSSLSSVRARAIDRMHRLVSLAALGAAACSSSPTGSTDNGYAVVDPMPSPARCAGGAGSIRGTAAFEVGPDGKRVLVIRLAPPTDPTTSFPPADASDANQTLKSDGKGLEIRVTPASGALTHSVKLNVQCAEGAGFIQVDVSWPNADVAPGVPLTVIVSSAYG